jgi:hypothetical protein
MTLVSFLLFFLLESLDGVIGLFPLRESAAYAK